MTSDPQPIPAPSRRLCTLGDTALADRLRSWEGLLHGADRRLLTSGVELWVDGSLIGAVRSLVEAERRCCRFLDLDVSEEGDRVRLTITGSDEAGIAVAQLFGAS